MGQGGFLKIYNATPFAIQQTASSHEYQMSKWSPPATIDSLTSNQQYIEFSQHWDQNEWDDGGDMYYGLQSTYQTLHIQACSQSTVNGVTHWLQYQSNWSNQNGQPLNSPYYMFWSTGENKWSLLSNDTKQIGWNWNGLVELKIVQINYYCTDDSEALQIVSDLVNDNQGDSIFVAFLANVTAAISKM